MKNSKFVIVSPVKNEEDYLPKLASCIINQSLLPDVWLIIDDGSSDKTPSIIESLKSENDWIHSIRISEGHKRNFSHHFSRIIRKGMEKALEISNDDVKYIMKVDADVRIHDETFEKLFEKMEQNEELGVVSPRFVILKEEIDTEILKDPEELLKKTNLISGSYKKNTDEPTDGLRIYRREYLDDIGGYPITEAAAHVVYAKAVMRGYHVGFIDDIWGYIARDTGSTLESTFIRAKYEGKRKYQLHTHPLILLGGFILKMKNNATSALGYLIGYFSAFINKLDKINDSEVREYNRKKRINEITEYFKS